MCQEDYDQVGLSSLRLVYQDFDLQRLHIYTAEGRFKDVSKFDSEMNTLLDQALQYRRNTRGTHL